MLYVQHKRYGAVFLYNYFTFRLSTHNFQTKMSQKSITSFFSKSPVNKIVKRSLSDVENIDSSNVITEEKKIKLDLDNEINVIDQKSLESLDNPSENSVQENIPVKTGKDMDATQRTEINKLTAELKLLSKSLPAVHYNMGLTWFQVLKDEFNKPYFKKLNKFLVEERSHTKPIYPRADQVWTWTRECRVDEIKAVIIGQDPYHHPGQAHGLSFSVPLGVLPPPSLVNMYKELENDIEGFKKPGHGNLTGWAQQGVLLLNAVLTVRCRSPNSHKDQGWEKLTDAVIKHLNSQSDGIVFLLWGSYAQKKAEFVDAKRHHLLKSVHPSPLSASRGFFGCKHFSMCNELLVKQGKKPIDWGHLPSE